MTESTVPGTVRDREAHSVQSAGKITTSTKDHKRCDGTGSPVPWTAREASSVRFATAATVAYVPDPPYSSPPKRDRRPSRLLWMSSSTVLPSALSRCARLSAGAMSEGLVTVMPTAPRPSAILA